MALYSSHINNIVLEARWGIECVVCGSVKNVTHYKCWSDVVLGRIQ